MTEKKMIKKLELKRETVRVLDDSQLAQANGAFEMSTGDLCGGWSIVISADDSNSSTISVVATSIGVSASATAISTAYIPFTAVTTVWPL